MTAQMKDSYWKSVGPETRLADWYRRLEQAADELRRKEADQKGTAHPAPSEAQPAPDAPTEAAPVEAAVPTEAEPVVPATPVAPSAPAEPPAPASVPRRRSPRRPRKASSPAPQMPETLDAAALERIPEPVRALLLVPESETAQRYYSKPFKESRAELIRRLLDPPLTLEETARILNVCPMTVRRYTNRGVLPHYRTAGDQRRFRLSDVIAFLEKQGHGKRGDAE